jgi:hypothetical protein
MNETTNWAQMLADPAVQQAMLADANELEAMVRREQETKTVNVYNAPVYNNVTPGINPPAMPAALETISPEWSMSPEELSAKRAAEHAKKYPNRLSLTARERFEQAGDVEWLVQDLIETAGIGQVWAPSYMGKTLFALDLGLSVACGLSEWLGTPINGDGPQHVIYVAAEGGASFWQHVNTWRMAHNMAWDVLDEYFHVIDSANGEGVVFGEDGLGEEIETSFSRLVDEWTSLEYKPALIIFDTQVDVIDVDENDNKRMSGVLRYIRDYGSREGFMSVLVHHTGHDGSRARGASSMRSKVDFMVGLRKVKDSAGAEAVEVMWSEDGAKIKAGPLPESNKVFYITTEPGTKGAYAKGLHGINAARFSASREVARQNKVQREEQAVIEAIAEGKNSASQIAEATGLNRTSVVMDTLKRLEASGEIQNTGKSTKPVWELKTCLPV